MEWVLIGGGLACVVWRAGWIGLLASFGVCVGILMGLGKPAPKWLMPQEFVAVWGGEALLVDAGGLRLFDAPASLELLEELREGARVVGSWDEGPGGMEYEIDPVAPPPKLGPQDIGGSYAPTD